MKTYEHVSRAVFGTPWYTTPDNLDVIAGVVAERRALGGSPPLEAIAARLAESEAMATAGPRGGARVQGAVAVIPVYGTLLARANMLTEFSGGATYQGIGRAFREAMADESIGSVVFDIDSPGGEVAGCDELATEIRNARGRKPMVAVANALMASAAYYLGCQADEVVASPSALVGSIGCVIVHQEGSRMLDELGVTTTVLRDPPSKADANPWEPLTPEARAHLQERASDAADMFRGSVAKARGVPVSAVKAGYGEGRALTARRALDAGLVDRVATLEDTIHRLATGRGPVSRGTKAEDGVHPLLAAIADQPDDERLGSTADLLAAHEVTINDVRLAEAVRTTEAQAAVAVARARAAKR